MIAIGIVVTFLGFVISLLSLTLAAFGKRAPGGGALRVGGQPVRHSRFAQPGLHQ